MVNPLHHRGGYGSQMMEHFLDYVRKMNMKKVLVATSQHAENFFKKFGANSERRIQQQAVLSVMQLGFEFLQPADLHTQRIQYSHLQHETPPGPAYEAMCCCPTTRSSSLPAYL